VEQSTPADKRDVRTTISITDGNRPPAAPVPDKGRALTKNLLPPFARRQGESGHVVCEAPNGDLSSAVVI